MLEGKTHPAGDGAVESTDNDERVCARLSRPPSGC